MTLQNLGRDVEAREFGGAFVDFDDAGLAVATEDEARTVILGRMTLQDPGGDIKARECVAP
jgi:hypothetical protein